MGQGMTGSKDHSESTANLIDEEVQRILTEAYDTCMNLLVEHKKELIDLSEILIEKEVLDANEVIHILKHGTLPEPIKPEPIEAPAEETPAEASVVDEEKPSDVDDVDAIQADPQTRDSTDEDSSGMIVS
jgi:cell division protease FtsH